MTHNSSAHLLDDENEDIPFTALKDVKKYAAFVTNISPNSNLENIKTYVSGKLGTQVTLKPLGNEGAACLSFGVFCETDSANMDFKMTGLWPTGTVIYKWNPKVRTPSKPGSRPANSYRRNIANVNRNNNSGTVGFKYRYADQKRLHSQYV